MSQDEIDVRTDELTDAVQVLTGAFPNLRADHRPNGADWYRWLIVNDKTSVVVGVVRLDSSGGKPQFAGYQGHAALSRDGPAARSRLSRPLSRAQTRNQRADAANDRQ